MRVLALDHGTVRIGVAVSDELGMIARPLEFIPAEPWADFLARLNQLLAELKPEQIIVGLPRNMDGSLGPAAEKVRAFVAKLRETVTVPIRTWDERLTTVQAQRMLREAGHKAKDQKGRVDATAAAVLLQSYLDSQGG
jgi:putative holliday junction resolvase